MRRIRKGDFMAAWLRGSAVFALAAFVHTAPPPGADETAPVIGLHAFTP